MKTLFLSALSLALSLFTLLNAQNIVYADVNKNDVERMNFEILGSSADNYLVYKEANGKHRITVYDPNMKVLEEVPVTVLSKRNDILDVSFYTTGSHSYLLYQYQDGDIVYLKAASIEANGRILEQPVVLDTTMIAYKTENKIYNIVTSNDNSKLLVFKINKKDRNLYRFTTRLFDENLQQISESRFSLPMEYKGDYLTGYSLANDGSYIFLKYNRQQNGNISEASLIEKPAGSDDYSAYKLNIGNLFLDDIKVLVDDRDGRYLLASFYSTQKRGDIDGIYVYGYDKNAGNIAFEKTSPFSDDLKKRAKGKNNTKNAFNNFFINNIIVHSDGSFTVNAEALSNTGNEDRWGYWGSPFWGPGLGYWGGWGPGWGWGWGRMGGFGWPYSYYSPFFYRSYWWGGWGPGWGRGWYGGGSPRFNAGNIAVLSFNNNGDKAWDQVIVKSQSASNTDGSISYQVVFSGDEAHYLLNNSGKISDLENIVINGDGTIREGTPVPAKDKHIDFMPKYGKQVGPNTIIIPYTYKSNIAFAKVEL
ncbi:MAG: hypothetical protein QM640_15145 [Niabella sp.]